METKDHKSPSDDLRGAAFHEAGHAIVARYLGLNVGEIKIGFDDDPVKGTADISCADQLSVVDQLAVCAAGMEAQEIFDAPTHDVAGFGDAVKMLNLLEDVPEEEASLLRKAAYRRARDILQAHLAEVEELAKRLIEERRIGAWPI